MVMSVEVGDTRKLFSTLAVATVFVPCRLSAMDICIKRYESVNSPLEFVCSHMTPMGALPSGRPDVHWYCAWAGVAEARMATARAIQILFSMKTTPLDMVMITRESPSQSLLLLCRDQFPGPSKTALMKRSWVASA